MLSNIYTSRCQKYESKMGIHKGINPISQWRNNEQSNIGERSLLSPQRRDQMPNEQRPRLSIEITEEQNLALQRLIPWGVKNSLFGMIVDDLISMLEKHGEIVLAAIFSRKLKLKDFPSMKEK